MLDAEIKVNQVLLQYFRMLVGDLPDERLTDQPLPGVNHPAWILGHLATAADSAAKRLGEPYLLPDDWSARYKGGSVLTSVREQYPSKAELMNAVEKGYARIQALVGAARADQLAQPSRHERLEALLPTVGDLLAFLLGAHMAVHLGQLSAWRRMIGLPALF